MKRIRGELETDASAKKVHYHANVKGCKEKIFRCTHSGCAFVACTPHNVMQHVNSVHNKENHNKMIE